jgi:cardiolipin synthase (CMP-forming)
MNLPNLISIARILLVPVTVWLLISEDYQLAFLSFSIAGASDAIDGWLARATKTESELSAYLDPIADKLLIVSTYAVLGIIREIPAGLVISVISRDVLIVGGLLLAWIMGKTFAVKPLLISKANTLFQIVFICIVLVNLSFELLPEWALDTSGLAVGTLTIVSGLAYMKQWIDQMNRSEA